MGTAPVWVVWAVGIVSATTGAMVSFSLKLTLDLVRDVSALKATVAALPCHLSACPNDAADKARVDRSEERPQRASHAVAGESA